MITAKEIFKKYWITAVTLNNWRRSWKLNYIKVTDRFFLYDEKFFKQKEINKNREPAIYARVSTINQKKDLDNQIKLLKQFCIKNGLEINRVYSDIWSWLNEDRKWLNELLNAISNQEISTVYITYKDRLSRFWFWYIEKIAELHWTKIKILEWVDETEEEIVEDLISIIHHYSTKMYSERRKQFKKIKNELLNNKGN